jgi:prephenate dehydratase
MPTPAQLSGPDAAGGTRPADGSARSAPLRRQRIAYLGPEGTFTEEALLAALSDAERAEAELVAAGQMADVLALVDTGEATAGFVPIENSIEGSVTAALDRLIFDHDLLIWREVVRDIHLHLLGLPNSRPEQIRRVLTYPVALGQCRGYLARELGRAEVAAAASTADAARQVRDLGRPDVAAVGPETAATLYGLQVLAGPVEDHPGNQTRFLLVGKGRIPAPTGHDKTTIVCFQRRDQPGSLLAILEQFAARSINLTRIESRPTRQGIGRYCFLVDLAGHVADELVADCLRALHAEVASLKFLGSYPAAGADGPDRRRRAQAAWRAAEAFVDDIRRLVEPPTT